MKTFGLTGGIGMGKSTSAQLLRDRGVAVVDTDALARQLVEPGQPALAEIIGCFGPDIVAPDGRLRRDELARRVFSDEASRRRLENILHPKIRELWLKQLEAWRGEGCPLAVVVIPLLFETGAERRFDSTICIACSAATQHQRLQARGWGLDEIKQRIGAQLSTEKKMHLSDFIIWTEGEVAVHTEQLERIIH